MKAQTRFREIALLAGSVLLSVALIEAVFFLAYPSRLGGGASWEEVRRRLRLDSGAGGAGRSEFVLHPYLGFTRSTAAGSGANRFGFLGPAPDAGLSRGKTVVAVTGGSVAQRLYGHRERLKERLRRVPGFDQKPLELVSLAASGYKQPQQLLALQYLLAQGCRFDAVINLDGFNEVALPYVDNARHRIEPAYPYNWNVYADASLDFARAALLGRLALAHEQREHLRRAAAARPMRYSAVFLAFADFFDRRLESRMYALQTRLNDYAPGAEGEGRPDAYGPVAAYADRADVLADAVRIWKAGSAQLARVCAANGIRYYHFLQPNLYHEGSKRLTREEAALAAVDDEWRRGVQEAVRRSYGKLIEEGARLRQEGVPFYDLSQIFKDEKGGVYQDSCCHFNGRGNELLIEAMAGAMEKN